ncbi:MAG TPA: hypothetical protein PK530_12885 [Anaerolineales bacterium]|nr:hypothetical protein [Anaerolineales bacterium]
MTDIPPSSPQPTPLTDEEVRRRIKGLIKLGNAPKVAELILLQAGATPEQVKTALQEHQQEKQAEVKEQGFLGWVIVLASIVVILIVLYLWLNWPGGNRQAPAPTSAPLDTEALISGLLQRFLDTQNVPPLDDIPEPFIEFDENGKNASCPKNESKAAALFGASGTWTFQDDANGWVFYNDTLVTLTIPKNMAGSIAYGSARSPKFMPVIGPAKVSNVYMAFVLCP